MKPALEDGDIVIALKTMPRPDQIAIVRRGDQEIIKRVASLKGQRYYLLGDNAEESTDSRHYGHVHKKDIIGTIMMTVPRAIAPPRPVRSYGIWLGRSVGVLLVLMTLVHLFRVDTFIPILDEALPSGPLIATIAALGIILTELCAIPFAFRMTLSSLAHLISGALVVFAPLWWIVVDILTIGTEHDNTGQLGEFVAIPSTVSTIVLNVGWLLLAYLTLHALGYNNISSRSALRK